MLYHSVTENEQKSIVLLIYYFDTYIGISNKK